jgi:hypothetical protein
MLGAAFASVAAIVTELEIDPLRDELRRALADL